MGENRNAYRVSVGKPNGKGPLEKHGYNRSEDNTKTGLKVTRWGDMD
jgi:hypothetical protein